MRITGVMIVRNEEDIVEASIRHNLAVVDAIAVTDHASTDATPAILASLVAEGLPIELSRDDSIGYLQSNLTTQAVRRQLEAGADLCVPIDADAIRFHARRGRSRDWLAGVYGAAAVDAVLAEFDQAPAAELPKISESARPRTTGPRR